MRYSLIIAAIFLLGIGEYAFVELAPLNKQQRKERLERFPIFKHIVHYDDYRMIREAFRHDQGALVEYPSGQVDTVWTSSSDLFDAFVRRNVIAEMKVKQLRKAQENRELLPRDRRLAELGSTWHKAMYMHRSSDSYDESDTINARRLLEADTTATGAWFSEYFRADPQLDFDSSNGIVLWTRYLLEDMHHPDDSAEETHAHDDQLLALLSEFVQRSQDGDPAAVEGLDLLSSEYGIELPDVIANWKSIRSHHPSS